MRQIEKACATPYCNTGLLLASGATAASQQDCRCNTRHTLSSVYVLLRSCERPIESWRSPARSTSTPRHLQGKAAECCSQEALVQNALISCCEQATGTCNLVFTWRAEWMLSLLCHSRNSDSNWRHESLRDRTKHRAQDPGIEEKALKSYPEVPRYE